MNAFFQKLVEVSFVVLAFGSMDSESLGGQKPLLGMGKRAFFESREAVLFLALGTDCYSPLLLAGARRSPSKLLLALKSKVHSEQNSATWNSKAPPKRARKSQNTQRPAEQG